MAYLGFGVDSQGSLSAALEDIPDDAKAFLRGGFSQIASLKAEQWRSLIDSAIFSSGPNDLDLETAGGALGLISSDAAAVLSAAKLSLGVISFRPEAPGDFVDIAINTGVLDEANKGAVLAVLDFSLKHKREIKDGLDATALGGENLPSLRRFELNVDVRVGFGEAGVDKAVPVVIAHVDTDAQEMELWFQMTPNQLTALIAKLQKVELNVRQAREFISNATPR